MTTQTDEEILDKFGKKMFPNEPPTKDKDAQWWMRQHHLLELMALARQDEREKIKAKCKRYCKCDCGLHKENGDY